MHFAIVTLFPAMFKALEFGVLGKAIQKRLITIACFNPRDFTQVKHSKVDDKPYGGGPGMVMMAQPLCDAVAAAQHNSCGPSTVVYLSPQGKSFNQAMAQTCAVSGASIVLVAGRYEGVDERFIQTAVDVEWSIGDYIISGGEFAAMVIIDAISRFIPEVIQQRSSIMQDSFGEECSGLLKYPQYTRPRSFAGLTVPDILHSGDHGAIKRWRIRQALDSTWRKRPDLIGKIALTAQEQALLHELSNEQ